MDYIICSYVIKLISQSLFPRHVDSVCSASSNVASNHSIFHPRCHAILFKCCSCSRCGFATGCFCITNHLQQVKLQKQRDINSLFHPAKQEPQFQHRYSVCMYIRDGTICIYRIYSVYSYLDTVYTTHIFFLLRICSTNLKSWTTCWYVDEHLIPSHLTKA